MYQKVRSSVRSSKDYFNTLAFIENLLLLKGPRDSIIGAVNVNLSMTIVGSYISNYLGQAAYVGKSNQLDCIKIKTKTGLKRIFFMGGSKINSKNSLQGLTLTYIYLTEVNLLHPSFVEECLNRIALSTENKIFMTLNPLGEKHWFYEKLNQWMISQEDNPDTKFLNYIHATLRDNPSMTEEAIRLFVMSKDPNSVDYKRSVLGLRVTADGLMFNITEDNFIDSFNKDSYIDYITILDLGVTKSATTMLLVAKFFNKETKLNEIHLLKEYYHISMDVNNPQYRSDEEYADDYAKFIKESMDLLGKAPRQVYVDASTVFRKTLKQAQIKHKVAQFTAQFVRKENLEECLKDIQHYIYSNKIKIYKSLKKTDELLRNAQYDTKAYESGKLKILKQYDEDGHGDMYDTLIYGFNHFKLLNKI